MTAMPPGPPSRPGEDAAWGLPPSPDVGRRPTRRAAVLCWVTGGLMLLLSGCASLVFVGVSIVPRGQFVEEWRGQGYTQQEIDAMLALIPTPDIAAIVGLVTMLLFVLPAMVLLVLGFFVRGRSRGVVRTAQAVALYLVVLTGIGALTGIGQGVTSGNGCLLVMSLLVNGGVVALLVWTWRTLGESLRGGEEGRADAAADSVEPWNRHLSDRY